MKMASMLADRYFSRAAGELAIGGVPVSRVADEYGTPLFLYDGHVLDRKWALLRETFPPEFSICYSVKANPNPAVLRHFLNKGSGLEIASGGEFHLALQSGCPPQKIFFAGPGKTERELVTTISCDIGEIHSESLLEVERVSTISRRLGKKARIAIRVNPTGEVQGGAMRMGGKPAPFGVDEETLQDVVDRVMLDPCIEFCGLHLFTGTQILDAALLLLQYRKGIEIAKRVVGQVQRPLQTLDFGGGLGIPYFAQEQELDAAQLRTGLAELMSEIRKDEQFVGTRFVVEPGRYLVGESGIYLTRVNDIKVSRGKKFIIVDGGMNHHLAASGNLGQVLKRNFPVALLEKMDKEPKETVDIVGPLCTPLDVLARDVHLPSASIGDLVGVFQSGAYSRTASPMEFLSHPAPAEVLVYEGGVRLIRRRGTDEDLLRHVP